MAESARNVACSGAKPMAMTNCLNFGNPMKPEIFWQFHRAVEGMTQACKSLNTPVTGGNVSFYNENPKGAIQPTPTVGMVGILEDIHKRVPSFFQQEGDLIFLLGETKNEIGASHYLWLWHGLKRGLVPRLDLEKEVILQRVLLEASDMKLLQSCHDISEGGLAVALAECCLADKLRGAEVDHIDLILGQTSISEKLPVVSTGIRLDAVYFGESQSRVVVSVSADQKEAFLRLVQRYLVPVYQIGKVGGINLVIGDRIKMRVKEVAEIYQSAIPKRMQQ